MCFADVALNRFCRGMGFVIMHIYYMEPELIMSKLSIGENNLCSNRSREKHTNSKRLAVHLFVFAVT